MAVIGNAPFQGLVSGGNIIDASIEGVDLSTSAIAARLGYTPVDPGAAVFSANPTISSGTANGLAYLNGSKVLTTGSALTFDGTSLTSSGSIYAPALINTSNGTSYFTDASTGNGIYVGGSTASPANTIRLFINASEQMRLTSTGLGIGTNSPGTKLDVNGVGRFGELASKIQIGLNGDSISMNGDLYIQTSTSNPLIFRTNATERVRIDTSGNLLVGTASSSGHRLQVVSAPGTVQMRWSDATNSTGYMDTISGASRIYTNTNLVFATGDPSTSVTERARIDSSGNFGIGTSSPYSKLDLGTYGSQSQLSWHQDATTSYGHIGTQNNSAAIGLMSGLKMGSGANSFASSISATWGKSAILLNYGNIQFFTNTPDTVAYGTAYTPTERVRIDSSGSLLVGRTSSSGLGQIQSDIGADLASGSGSVYLVRGGGNVLVGTTSSPGTIWSSARTFAYVKGSASNNSGEVIVESNNGNQQFSLFASGGSAEFGMWSTKANSIIFGNNNTERARIDSSGNFGLGTTAPNNGGNNGRWLTLSAIAGSTYSGGLSFAIGGTNQCWIYQDTDNLLAFQGAGSNAGFKWMYGGTERARINSSGNLGIGTTAPGTNSKLDVIGNITIDSAFSSQYGLCFRRGFESSDNLRIYAGDTGQNRVGGLRLSGYDGIAFGTGSNSWQERMRIDINGKISCNSELTATGNFRVYSGGGEYAFIGNVWKSDTSHQYIHVKTSLSMYSYKMTMFRVVGYGAYEEYAESYLGCYTYGEYPTNTMAGAYPYGILLANQGNRPAAQGMYYSSDGYLCLLLNWPSFYTGLAVHYIAAGGSHGVITEIKVLSFTSNSSTGKAY
jgi:hypothetical protein